MVNLLEWLTELRKTFIYIYQFIIKNNIKDTGEQSDEEMDRVRPGIFPSTEASFPKSWDVSPSWSVGVFINLEAL